MFKVCGARVLLSPILYVQHVPPAGITQAQHGDSLHPPSPGDHALGIVHPSIVMAPPTNTHVAIPTPSSPPTPAPSGATPSLALPVGDAAAALDLPNSTPVDAKGSLFSKALAACHFVSTLLCIRICHLITPQTEEKIDEADANGYAVYFDGMESHVFALVCLTI